MSCNRRDHSVRPAALTPVLFLVLALPATAQTPGGGTYTEDQANRGQAVFAQLCTECHEADLRGTDNGPELAQQTPGQPRCRLSRQDSRIDRLTRSRPSRPRRSPIRPRKTG